MEDNFDLNDFNALNERAKKNETHISFFNWICIDIVLFCLIVLLVCFFSWIGKLVVQLF